MVIWIAAHKPMQAQFGFMIIKKLKVERLNHNQSRHACSGFEQILRNDLVRTQGESQ